MSEYLSGESMNSIETSKETSSENNFKQHSSGDSIPALVDPVNNRILGMPTSLILEELKLSTNDVQSAKATTSVETIESEKATQFATKTTPTDTSIAPASPEVSTSSPAPISDNSTSGSMSFTGSTTDRTSTVGSFLELSSQTLSSVWPSLKSLSKPTTYTQTPQPDSSTPTSSINSTTTSSTQTPANSTHNKGTQPGNVTMAVRSSSTTRRPASKVNADTPADWHSKWVLHAPTTSRPYQPERDCGVRSMKREGRVVGGRDSQQGEFPWSVLIRETTLLGFFVKTKCGGVLIDLKWVLTAAHCQPGMFGSLVVVVGEYDLESNSHSHSSKSTNQKLRPVIKKVKRMIIHRDYNPSNFDNDIALLELESPYQVQPHVVPICLPEKDEEFIGRPAMVAGWGKLSFGGPVPSVLQVAKLPVIGNKQCQDMYQNSGHMKLISDSFLCAGYANGGQDSCEGDSGGPLQVQRNNSRWVLVGTVSHGIKCAEPNLPGIYIRTAAYLPWIKAVTYHQDQNKRYGHRLLAATQQSRWS